MKRLSIIIPIYNVEPFVERCLRSLEDQDIPRDTYEIICINDGSPDNSHEIVVRLQREYNNIFLINQKNQGVSRARNAGIEKACGKYLLFIDPDDYIDANSFARILITADEQESQVSFLGFTVLNEKGEVRNRILNENYKLQIFVGPEAYFLARGDGRTDPDRMWAVLFRTDFLNKNSLRFLPNVPYLEDGEFIARILSLAERCTFCGHSFYQRTTRPGSATNSKLFHSESATNGFLMAAINLRNFQRERELKNQQREFLNQPILKFVLLAINSSVRWTHKRKLNSTIKTLRNLSLRKLTLNGCKQPYSFYGRAYNFSPYIAALALIIYPRVNKLNRLLFSK